MSVDFRDPMDFQDRCRGLMVGLGVGNLLGLGHEGMSRDAIRARWQDGIRDIEASSGYPDRWLRRLAEIRQDREPLEALADRLMTAA